MTALLRGLVICLLCLLAVATGAARAGDQPASGQLVEVVVGLSQQPLAVTRWKAGRQLQARTLVSAQNRVADTIAAQLPDAQIRWHYKLVANGMAVVVPRSQLGRLIALPGVAKVYPSVRYRPQLDRSVPQIGAPTLWGPGLENAGQGMKIAIIDEGIDQRHPFFSPAGYTMPAGFPKGQTAYTTAKVIVARAFPPARPTWKNASKPFDPNVVVPRHPRRGHCRGQRQHPRRRDPDLRRRAPRVPRQLQGADDSHRRRCGPGRQLAGARGCDRSSRRRRHGRDQHVPRRARDRAVPRHRGAGTGRSGSRRRGLRRRRRQRLQRLRARVDRLARLVAGRDHGRRGLDVAQRPDRRRRLVLLERADTALACASSRK